MLTAIRIFLVIFGLLLIVYGAYNMLSVAIDALKIAWVFQGWDISLAE